MRLAILREGEARPPFTRIVRRIGDLVVLRPATLRERIEEVGHVRFGRRSLLDIQTLADGGPSWVRT